MKKWILGLVVLFMVVYLVGPKPPSIDWNFTMPAVPLQASQLEKYILAKEHKHKVKPDNEARIIWADSLHQKTEYAVVYLHGFPASQKEGDPVHKQFAKAFGCNLFLARLSDQGIDTTETLLNFTAERYWESVKEALAVGNAIGNKVILLSTSTGSTGALMLAAHFPDRVYALLNLSPNIELKNPAAFILDGPWGLQVARLANGGKYRIDPDDETSPFWNNTYRLEAAVQLERLVEGAMTNETFQKINQPVLSLAYYKNDDEQDPTVKVSAMIKMHEQLATPDSMKLLAKLPNVGAHAMGSDMRSKDIHEVGQQLENFAVNYLKLKKVID